MTLIAAVLPADKPYFLADVLVSGKNIDAQDFDFPTRAYLPPEVRQQTGIAPTRFARKVVEIFPRLIAFCAGDEDKITKFAYELRDWFQNTDLTVSFLEKFQKDRYEKPVDGFSAIIAIHQNRIVYLLNFGQVAEIASCEFGRCFAAGSGTGMFSRYLQKIDQMVVGRLTDRAATVPLANVIRLANGLLFDEISSGVPLRQNFGGAYEIIYSDRDCFRRVDDLQHIFLLVECTGDEIVFRPYTHTIRQWYQGDDLYVASLSTEEAEAAGLGFKYYVIPHLFSLQCAAPNYQRTHAIPANLCVRCSMWIDGVFHGDYCFLPTEIADVIEFKFDGSRLVSRLLKPFEDLIREATGVLRRERQESCAAAISDQS